MKRKKKQVTRCLHFIHPAFTDNEMQSDDRKAGDKGG